MRGWNGEKLLPTLMKTWGRRNVFANSLILDGNVAENKTVTRSSFLGKSLKKEELYSMRQKQKYGKIEEYIGLESKL